MSKHRNKHPCGKDDLGRIAQVKSMGSSEVSGDPSDVADDGVADFSEVVLDDFTDVHSDDVEPALTDFQSIYDGDSSDWIDTLSLYEEMDRVLRSDNVTEIVIDTAEAKMTADLQDTHVDYVEFQEESDVVQTESKVASDEYLDETRNHLDLETYQACKESQSVEVKECEDTQTVNLKSVNTISYGNGELHEPKGSNRSKFDLACIYRTLSLDELKSRLKSIQDKILASKIHIKALNGLKLAAKDFNWIVAHNGIGIFAGIAIGVCASLTLYGLVFNVMRETSNDYSLRMNSMINRLTIGESDFNNITIGSSGDQESEVNSEFYDLDQYLLLNEISSIVTTGLPNPVSYLEKVLWNGIDIYIPEDMTDFEMAVSPLELNVSGQDLQLDMNLLRFNTTLPEKVRTEMIQFQKDPSISGSVIESSKEEEHRAFLQLTYKKIMSDGKLESRTRYIAMVQLTDGIGLLCVYDSGPQAPVESQTLLFDSLIANVTDRFI